MKRLVRHLIKQKGLDKGSSIGPQQTAVEALNLLQATNTSATLVMDQGNLCGIFSEKDFTRAILKGFTPDFTKVSEIMTRRVYFAEPDFTLEDCLQIMTKVHVRHIPVLENGSPIALLSMRHIMEALVEEKEDQIRDLTTYITGSQAFISFDSSRLTAKIIPIYHEGKVQVVS